MKCIHKSYIQGSDITGIPLVISSEITSPVKTISSWKQLINLSREPQGSMWFVKLCFASAGVTHGEPHAGSVKSPPGQERALRRWHIHSLDCMSTHERLGGSVQWKRDAWPRHSKGTNKNLHKVEKNCLSSTCKQCVWCRVWTVTLLRCIKVICTLLVKLLCFLACHLVKRKQTNSFFSDWEGQFMKNPVNRQGGAFTWRGMEGGHTVIFHSQTIINHSYLYL